MIIERHLSPYLVFADDSVLVALRKMTENRERIVFCVDSNGLLKGSLSDGDFRRWIVANPDADLEVASAQVANTSVASAPLGSTTEEILELLPAGASHLPLLDDRGRLTALAINRASELRIGDHRIGENQPSFIIAEIGNNHQGDLELGRRLVDAAADAGADCVKFQLRDMDALYRQSGSASGGEDLGAQYTLDLLAKYSLPAQELFQLFDHARDRSIEVMCTPWDLPSVQALVDYGIPAFKIASADLTNHDLLREAGRHGRPLILSTGMSREEEIRETAELVRSLGVPFAMLHCQSTYPAPFKDVNLAYMDRLEEIAQAPVGYSGHERGIHVPVAAVARGARIIEKHLTVDRSLEGNDHKVSLLPDEFAAMVQQIREVEESLGTSAERVVSTGEAMNRINLAKSLVAARPLEIGAVISESDVAVKSPGRGLQPNALPQLVGRTVRRAMAEGDFFFEGDLKETVPTGRQFQFNRPWGLPVRYHDVEALTKDCTPDFLEFHFSYKDLEIDVDSVFSQPLPMGFTTHLPDLFAGDFLVDLASQDQEHWERSIAEVQRTIDITRQLTRWFPSEQEPIMVVTMGGFTTDRHITPEERTPKYERIAEAQKRLDSSGVRIAAQTLPPFPWLMGGQQYHNLFLDPRDTAEFARSTGTDLCLDISHTKLAATFLNIPFSETVELLAPHTIHLHLVDATGVDGEGVQVGEGDVDWPALAEQLDRLVPGAPFIPEIWQGHINNGEGFWTALDRLEQWL
ncbi:N-acetylneuraminate synthase family protein [Micrococcus terreus]|uniref:N-acetylneuraminate synthase family protein n=1 Tax=Micrococcus terreus TaxID=574650 RepID=UPI00254CD78C|nr:N-acetylneuraminate synthase family protein [Micrococcus terreus]MDK7701944.1 N-acetylneuraminate synthase family protein [Micrococcus terreus]WOO97713.1 N-acetylneuraminate synthase family protein [Micrococcus terreus]